MPSEKRTALCLACLNSTTWYNPVTWVIPGTYIWTKKTIYAILMICYHLFRTKINLKKTSTPHNCRIVKNLIHWIPLQNPFPTSVRTKTKVPQFSYFYYVAFSE